MNTRPEQQRVMTLIAISLTFASGAADVTSFTRLGNVFTSVMTGNIVLWGLAVARGSLTLFSHTAVSIGGYITGVAAATLIAHRIKTVGIGPAALLEAHVTWVLRTELTLLAGFGAGWVVSGASPAGWAEFGLLATLAAAMGMQSAAVNDMGLAQVSTTFLTGTLTGLVSSLVSPGKKTPYRLRRYGVLAGLAAGASLGGLLVATAPYAVPALPLAALITTLFLAARASAAASPSASPSASPPPGEAEQDRGSSLPAGGP